MDRPANRRTSSAPPLVLLSCLASQEARQAPGARKPER